MLRIWVLNLFICLSCYAQEFGSKPLVVVSILPQKFVVDRVSGGTVEVSVLIPSGANEETYEPTVRDLKALSRAKLYLKLGHPAFPFERQWLPKIITSATALEVVNVGEGIPEDHDDPHVWTSAPEMRRIVNNVLKALIAILPAHTEKLQQNAGILLEEIYSADIAVREKIRISGVKRFLVFHPTWGYLAKTYGLEQISIEQQGKEPGPGQLARLIERSRSLNIKVVFVQPQHPHESARLIADELGGRVAQLDPLAYNWVENLKLVGQALASSVEHGS